MLVELRFNESGNVKVFFVLMRRGQANYTNCISSAASEVYKRQACGCGCGWWLVGVACGCGCGCGCGWWQCCVLYTSPKATRRYAISYAVVCLKKKIENIDVVHGEKVKGTVGLGPYGARSLPNREL